jgi:hypothetical protein
MDPVRFDQLSKCVAMRLSRRRAVQALGAAAVAGAVLSQRHQDAAADCPDNTVYCSAPFYGSSLTVRGSGVNYGQCWNWSTFSCELCAGVIEAATQRRNETWPDRCNGQCTVWAKEKYGLMEP